VAWMGTAEDGIRGPREPRAGAQRRELGREGLLPAAVAVEYVGERARVDRGEPVGEVGGSAHVP
jgi:hypothetical protein